MPNKLVNQPLIGLSWEEFSKHVVAWQAPDGMKQVNVTLVDNVYETNQAHIGSFGKNQLIKYYNARS
jgi:hypothetical protein